MSFNDSYIAIFDHEAKSTRKMLERIPVDKFDWVPHAKSMKLGTLGVHIASLPHRVKMVLTFDEFDAKSPAAAAARPPAPATTQELVDQWDRHMTEMRSSVSAATEEQLAGTFTLKSGEQVIFSAPRKVVLRGFILNHMIHHRGELSVYLRLLDIPVPSIYGPSADEK